MCNCYIVELRIEKYNKTFLLLTGMWGLFKRKKKQKRIVKETVSIKNLPNWFGDLKKDYIQEFEKSIISYQKLLNHATEEVEEALIALEKGDLHNSNISEREKHFFEGNKDAYLKSVRTLLDNVDLSESAYDIQSSIVYVQNQLQRFNTSTHRQYQILQNFLANEARDVALAINQIDKNLQDLKGHVKSYKLDVLFELDKQVQSLSGKIEYKEKLENRSEQVSLKLAEGKGVLDETREKLENIRCDDGDILVLQEELKKYEDSIVALERNMNAKFLVLGKALEKFSRVAFENQQFIDSYIKNPISTLKEDYDLRIMRILTNLKRGIEEGSVELKEQKAAKVRKLIINTDVKEFKEFQAKYNELWQAKMAKENEIANHCFTIRENELLGRIEKLETDIDNLEGDFVDISKKLSKIDIDAISDEIKASVTKLFSRHIEISF